MPEEARKGKKESDIGGSLWNNGSIFHHSPLQRIQPEICERFGQTEVVSSPHDYSYRPSDIQNIAVHPNLGHPLIYALCLHPTVSISMNLDGLYTVQRQLSAIPAI
jgi:hypothetical protein